MDKHVFRPSLPPPTLEVGVLGWLRGNLFSSVGNTLLTLLACYLLWLIVPPLLDWTLLQADFTGSQRSDCSGEGACWVFVRERFTQFMYGFYPAELRWRVNLTVWLAVIGASPLFMPIMPRKDVIAASLADRGALIHVTDLDEACLIANRIAPEHLELAVHAPRALVGRIRHAGAIFMGHYTSESLGDYCAGPNHVLPRRAARVSPVRSASTISRNAPASSRYRRPGHRCSARSPRRWPMARA